MAAVEVVPSPKSHRYAKLPVPPAGVAVKATVAGAMASGGSVPQVSRTSESRCSVTGLLVTVSAPEVTCSFTSKVPPLGNCTVVFGAADVRPSPNVQK